MRRRAWGKSWQVIGVSKWRSYLTVSILERVSKARVDKWRSQMMKYEKKRLEIEMENQAARKWVEGMRGLQIGIQNSEGCMKRVLRNWRWERNWVMRTGEVER